MLRLVTPPEPALTVEEVKQWLRVDHDAEDDLIATLVSAATVAFDGPHGFLGRMLEPQEWEMVLDAFPSTAIHIPAGPVTEVISVAYVGGDGYEQSVASSAYELDTMPTFEGWVVPTEAWPAPMHTINAVRVRFRAGTGTPTPVKLAIMATVADWYDNRAAGQIPPGAFAIAAPYRMMHV